MSDVLPPIAVLAACLIAAAFGFPYLFPVTIFLAVYIYFTGKSKSADRKSHWKIFFWASVTVSAILIVGTLWLHPFELFEPTKTPMGSSDWQLQ